MNILIVGATGATGRLLVEQLLERGHSVTAVVRSTSKLPQSLRDHHNLTILEATLLDLTDSEMAQLVQGCDAIASCLGHNLTFKGIYGQPWKLVTDAARRLCTAVKTNGPERPVKYVLMNTTGNRNRDLDESISVREKIVVGLMRLLVPPHADNEQAAEYLRSQIGRNDPRIEWTAVRPDNLIDEEEVTPYEIHPSPIRSPLLDPGQTSRINVAHFMADLITETAVWQKWQGQMPVIYNQSSLENGT